MDQVPHPAARATDAELVRGRLQVGDFDLTICTDGTYLLDGGAMFGVVPKTLWQKRAPADAENRILLGLNSVVVRTGSALVVIETGIGNKQSDRMRAIHQNQMLLPASLEAAGVAPNDVTHVINTHLHFDHCGWNTTLEPGGHVRPTFPNARYFAHRGEVDHGHLQLERDAVSYLSPNYDPLISSGQMTLVDADSLRHEPAVVPGIWLEPFPGHTAQMLAVHIESAGQHACYIGDLIPTAHHVEPAWVMGYDLDPAHLHRRTQAFPRPRHPGKVDGAVHSRSPHARRQPRSQRQGQAGSAPARKPAIAVKPWPAAGSGFRWTLRGAFLGRAAPDHHL